MKTFTEKINESLPPPAYATISDMQLVTLLFKYSDASETDKHAVMQNILDETFPNRIKIDISSIPPNAYM